MHRKGKRGVIAGMLSSLFRTAATVALQPKEPPQNHLDVSDVRFLTGCFIPTGEMQTRQVVKSPDVHAEYIFKNQVENGVFELEINSRFKDEEYKTHVVAEYLGPDVLEMKSIVFDNQPEDLDNAKEIYSVLDYIGNQVRFITFGSMPAIHNNKGRFSTWGRFKTRHSPKPRRPDFL